jgi:hypothetical protein
MVFFLFSAPRSTRFLFSTLLSFSGLHGTDDTTWCLGGYLNFFGVLGSLLRRQRLSFPFSKDGIWYSLFQCQAQLFFSMSSSGSTFSFKGFDRLRLLGWERLVLQNPSVLVF